jgi:glycosyltransferase involved in cell wall biosynthesis
MLNGQRIVVVLPAYNASQTLERTLREVPFDIVDDVVLVDDRSTDDTVAVARGLNLRHVIVHDRNRGYGANQKTCYRKALELDADIIVMLHPDYQYTPRLITAMTSVIAYGVYPVVLGSRILGMGARRGGMPLYKYIANRMLTLVQNVLVGQKLSEYHTGYRAFRRDVLERIDFEANHDDFVFDNEVLSQIIYAGYDIAEITCPTKYFPEASSINFRRSVVYGFGVLIVSTQHFLQRRGLASFQRYRPKPALRPHPTIRNA